ncbi:hypothetical protein [Sphaerochaeta halotolerans]|uniref:hypothetical protein n=1 Tax=Sphaerochaeta halotolerans TaxID=2293840 RepID=UPI00136F277D|nr:hypothetical protein [Sphaerochaeta halotolerans]MXI85866.1 hypothetical protein [Sphaerochaeta halotolerans]
MKGINTPGQALDSGGVASFSVPRDGVSHLAFPALARESMVQSFRNFLSIFELCFVLNSPYMVITNPGTMFHPMLEATYLPYNPILPVIMPEPVHKVVLDWPFSFDGSILKEISQLVSLHPLCNLTVRIRFYFFHWLPPCCAQLKEQGPD